MNPVNSSGAVSMSVSKADHAATMSSRPVYRSPNTVMVGRGTSISWNVSDVFTPKLPPPAPRRPQNRSVLSLGPAVTVSPEARTMSVSTKWSHVRPPQRELSP